MTIEAIEKLIPEIEQDITYFENIGFVHLKDKFNRDLNIIKSLLEHSKKE